MPLYCSELWGLASCEWLAYVIHDSFTELVIRHVRTAYLATITNISRVHVLEKGWRVSRIPMTCEIDKTHNTSCSENWWSGLGFCNSAQTLGAFGIPRDYEEVLLRVNNLQKSQQLITLKCDGIMAVPPKRPQHGAHANIVELWRRLTGWTVQTW
jgi:hypothetical protein